MLALPWLVRDPSPLILGELLGVGTWPMHHLGPPSPAPVGVPMEPTPTPPESHRAMQAHKPSHVPSL